MATEAEDLLDLDLRLSRLEMQVLGVKLTNQLKESTTTETPQKSSPVKSISSLLSQDSSLGASLHGGGEVEDDMAVLDTKSSSVDMGDTGNKDLSSRLTKLEQTVAGSFAKSSQQRSVMDQLEGHWKDINKYLNDLDPGTALTHQQQIAAPLLYRRQEVLASAETLKKSMHQVAEILNLLMIGQQQSTNSKITEMHVTKAPILISVQPNLTREQRDQLTEVETTLTALADRVDAAALKMDRLLTGYQQLVTSVSEKLVLLDEEIRTKKQ